MAAHAFGRPRRESGAVGVLDVRQYKPDLLRRETVEDELERLGNVRAAVDVVASGLSLLGVFTGCAVASVAAMGASPGARARARALAPAREARVGLSEASVMASKSSGVITSPFVVVPFSSLDTFRAWRRESVSGTCG